MQLESGEKGWVKVTDWNSFQTGNFYQLCGSCLLFWWPVTILKLRARSAMSIHSFSIMLMHSFCLIVLLHASSQKNAGTRFRTVFLIVTVCAYMIDLLQAIQIQLCKYIILRIVQKEMSLVIDPRQGNELAFSYGKSKCWMLAKQRTSTAFGFVLLHCNKNLSVYKDCF